MSPSSLIRHFAHEPISVSSGLSFSSDVIFLLPVMAISPKILSHSFLYRFTSS